MFNIWIGLLLALWFSLGFSVCFLVRGGAIHEREQAKLAEAQRNIQRAIAL